MYDYVIIGGGIVGLSTGYALMQKYPGAKLAILEKENTLAFHQTGHNSGVIHSGIYYKPGSLKAKLSREGGQLLRDFCDTHEISYEMCGKVIVATEQEELPLLDNLYKRGLENGLDVSLIGPDQLKEIEPHAYGIGAIHVKAAGIVNYKQVANVLAREIQERGGEVFLGTKVEAIAENNEGLQIDCTHHTFHSRYLINCAGLHCDRIAAAQGLQTGMKIVPFRGEYYELKPEKHHLVKHLIYPVPNPNFPFLGVHFTRMIDGHVHAGPNAVLSLKREGYHKTDFVLRDFAEVMTYPAFWKIASQNLGEGMKEIIRSLSKKVFVKSLQRLIPEVREEDLVQSENGVRAQALTRDGKLVDDFFIVTNQRSTHILNAPSPAATASIAIGRSICADIPGPDEI
ncbi:L-2-hydroxyglutarate oxidase [Brevibacillus composti]|uniref:L-2-hydroxyglutarate oxidase n=1 Tax=Brevibacillus composti TaxID=2796470 RepID=A0A7T5EKN2_9BACL|nr:L-2-hydroxyglutarate oxidase [Brevibacillus composti]QQE74395.1 L-2-hydroxyglutarate oxidase [Brevibacillus composti]QUO41477.1 L-2-hydroxyglutarate oxidase [Brevibacillus composti]